MLLYKTLLLFADKEDGSLDSPIAHIRVCTLQVVSDNASRKSSLVLHCDLPHSVWHECLSARPSSGWWIAVLVPQKCVEGRCGNHWKKSEQERKIHLFFLWAIEIYSPADFWSSEGVWTVVLSDHHAFLHSDCFHREPVVRRDGRLYLHYTGGHGAVQRENTAGQTSVQWLWEGGGKWCYTTVKLWG